MGANRELSMVFLELHTALQEWREWAKTATKNEDGWQSDFPSWGALMRIAKSAMHEKEFVPEGLNDLAECWAISEETEDLRDYSADHVNECWALLTRLTDANYSECRWQAYDALAVAGSNAQQIIEKGLNDSNSYVRRRALLALGRVNKERAAQVATRFLDDQDPYLRQVALELTYPPPN